MGSLLGFATGLVGACVVILAAGPGTAQDARAPSGPVIAIVGDGGPVRTAGANVTVTGTANRVDAAGARVEVNATVNGPIRAAGALVTVGGSAEDDIKVAGGTVEVTGRFGGDAFLAAVVIRFAATVADDVEAGAASIEFGSATDVAGALSAGAANLVVEGKFGGPVMLGGANVTFNGSAAGDVTIEGGRVTIGPLAVIGGNLVIRTLTPPTIDPAARVTGKTSVEEPRFYWILSSWTWRLISAALMAAGTLLTGAILIGVARGTFEEALGYATVRPFSSGLIGLATVIILPLVAALLLATVIGLSFGLVLLMLLPFILVLGHAIVAACIGVWIFDRTGEPRSFGRLLLYLLAGAVIMAIVWLIPWVGAPVVGIAILVGAGSWVRSALPRLRRRTFA